MLRAKRESALTGFDVAAGKRVAVNASLPQPDSHVRPILSERTGIIFPRVLTVPGTTEVYGCGYDNKPVLLNSDWYLEQLKDGSYLYHQPGDFRGSNFDTGFAYHSGVHTASELAAMKAEVLEREREDRARAAIPPPVLSDEEKLRRENDDLKRRLEAAKAVG